MLCAKSVNKKSTCFDTMILLSFLPPSFVYKSLKSFDWAHSIDVAPPYHSTTYCPQEVLSYVNMNMDFDRNNYGQNSPATVMKRNRHHCKYKVYRNTLTK